MIRSMTGFGQSGRLTAGFRIQVELKSVNHRYAETAVRLPRQWLSLEDAVRKQVSRDIKRGRVDVIVNVEREGSSGTKVEVNWDVVYSYREAANQLKDKLGLGGDLSLQDLLQIPDAVRLVEDRSADRELIGEELLLAVSEAVQELSAMRMAEGQHLLEDLEKRLHLLKLYRSRMAVIAPRVAEEYKAKLAGRLQDLLGQVPLDENRVALEVAVFADRCSIDEELTRLLSHFDQFGKLLHSDEPSGRKLDFLIQEMNREVNTIGSKANHAELAATVVDMKAELEKIREQVQNIE